MSAQNSMLTMTPEQLEAMLDRAAERGATAALAAVGLHDEHAAADVIELRGLLSSWRETKFVIRTSIVAPIWATAIKWGTVAVLAYIVWRISGRSVQ